MADTKIIAVANQKGGVGKTTTTANLGYAFANLGKKVLLIDFDPQTSLTQYLNIPIDDEYLEISDLLARELDDRYYKPKKLYIAPYAGLIKSCIKTPTYKTIVREKDKDDKFIAVEKDAYFSENMDIIPTSLALADFELYLGSGRLDKEKRRKIPFLLRGVIREILKVKEYDYVLIDCAPSLTALTTNAIVAAKSGVLIPTNLDLMSTRGVVNLIKSVTQAQTAVIVSTNGEEQHMGVMGVALNLFRAGRSVDEKLQGDMQRYYPFEVFKNCIPESINAKKAVMGGLIYSQIYNKAEVAYTKLAKEIEKQIKKQEKEGARLKYIEKECEYTIDNVNEIIALGGNADDIMNLLMNGWIVDDVKKINAEGFTIEYISALAEMGYTAETLIEQLKGGKTQKDFIEEIAEYWEEE